MAESLLNDVVDGPLGQLEVSTVRMIAGGAGPTRDSLSPFNDFDYDDCLTWPFETMVFPAGQRMRAGLYHEAYADEDEARAGHARVVSLCTDGTLPVGTGIADGNPSLTPEQWNERSDGS